MALVEKNDIKQIFADQAPSIDKPASFANYPRGWDAARPNNGKPTIKQFNYLQQRTDQNILWMHQNGAALPYDATMEYAEGAVVVKDGELQHKKGDTWVSLIKNNDSVDSIQSMLNINNPKNNTIVYVFEGKQNGYFKYNSSRSTENDGGTIFNGWERIDFKAITFDMFDCDSNGVVAIDDKLLKICAASTRLNKPIHNFNGTYLVNSNSNFTFTENTLLDGTRFKLGTSFNGSFICQRADITNESLASGSYFNSAKSIGLLQSGRFALNNASEFTEKYKNHYVEFQESTPLYAYRGASKSVKFFSRLLPLARLETAPYFDVNFANLTLINLQSVADSLRLYSGFSFDESEAQALGMYFKVINSNRVVVQNLTYIDNSTIARSVNQYRIFVGNSYNILLNGVDASSALANNNSTYNYTLSLDSCYDVKAKGLKAFGYGWGATGSNSCSNIEFEDCVVNRIDFHEPCYNYLKINNCTIGDWGVLVTMIGDLHINNSTISNYEGFGNRGIIRSRTDAGGFCYGDLYIDNLKLNGYSGNAPNAVIYCQGDGVLPVGSPIDAVMFKNIYINGLYGKYSYNATAFLLSSDNNSTLNKPPAVIAVNGVYDINPAIDFGKFAKPSYDVNLTVKDMVSNQLYISDTSGKSTKVEALFDNLRGKTPSGVTVLNTANCDIRIVNSKILKYREYNQSWSAYNPFIAISNSALTDNDYISVNTTSKQRISCSDVRFMNPTQSNILAYSSKTRHYNCIFQGDSFATVWSSSSSVNTGSFAIPSAAGILDLVVGYGVNRKYLAIDVSQAQTYTIETGVTIIVSISGANATITLNATSANLLGIRNTM